MSSCENTARDQRETRLLHITDSVADDVFDALTSSTARAILAKTYEAPCSVADLVETIDASETEIQQELEALLDVNLLVDETEESNDEASHSVFRPSTTGIVLFAGDGVREISPRRGLTYLLGTVGVLAITSILVNQLVLSVFGSRSSTSIIASAVHDTPGGVVPNPTPTVTPLSGIQPIFYRPPPGLIFFAGGLAVLVVVGVMAYWILVRHRVPIHLPSPVPDPDD